MKRLYCRFLSCEEISTPVETPAEPEGQSEPEANPEQTTQEASNDDYNPEWYKSDGRVGKMWNSPDVRDDIVKSYYNLEKQYKPLAEQFKGYNSTLKELGIADMDALRALHTEYSELKDPNNRTNQLAGYISSWLDNPMYSQDVQKFFNDLDVRELQRAYPNMNAEQIQKQMELEQKVNALEAQRQEQERAEYGNRYAQQLQVATDKNLKLAESLGFNYSPEIHQACVNYVMKFDEQHGYPCSLTEAFSDLYGDKLDAARIAKMEGDVLKRIGNKPKVPTAGKKVSGIDPKGIEESKKSVIEKVLGVF